MVAVDIEGGPCGWVVDPPATGCCTDAWNEATPEQQTTGAVLAAAFLWVATGRQFGQCEVTVEACAGRPAKPTYAQFPVVPGDHAGAWGPYLLDGVWFNGPMGASWCCERVCELRLPGPIYDSAAILEVSSNGTVLDAADYQVYDGVKLVRTDGLCWPSCCNGGGGAGVTVNYLIGLPVPADLQIALDLLACEFTAACAGGRCRLPRQVSAMTQMGTTVDFSNLPAPGTPVMATGIYEIDSVIKSYNPYGLAARPKLYNPNRPRVRWPM